MKFNIAVATLFLTAAGATGAYAQDVTLTLSGAGVSLIGGVPTYTMGSLPGDAAFDGTLTNNSRNTYTFDGASITPLPLPAGVTESDQVNSNLNTYTLAPGQSATIPDLFDLQVPTGSSSFAGFFSLSDSAVAGAGTLNGIGVSQYAVSVAAVPEPSAIVLLAGSLLSGGLLLRRRK
jgi:hypothetical protein